MRSQWCREHIDEAAEKCGLGKDTVSDVKKAAAFCVDHEEYSNCSTVAIMALIDIRDDPVREKAISSISKAFDSNKHPVTGQILKDKKLTEREIKKVIEKAEMEVRGELSKKYAEQRKNKPTPEETPAIVEEKVEPQTVQPDPEPAKIPLPVSPVIVDSDKAKRERMEALAVELLSMYPSSIQTMVADIMREHISYKVKDIFYYGVQALAEQKTK